MSRNNPSATVVVSNDTTPEAQPSGLFRLIPLQLHEGCILIHTLRQRYVYNSQTDTYETNSQSTITQQTDTNN